MVKEEKSNQKQKLNEKSSLHAKKIEMKILYS